jgi:hypothetical protein
MRAGAGRGSAVAAGEAALLPATQIVCAVDPSVIPPAK